MTDNTITLPALAASACPESNASERTRRNLLKAIELVQALNAKEQELALVLLQSIAAWNGLAEPERTQQ